MTAQKRSRLPAYLKMSRPERMKRIEKLYKMMQSCTYCPRRCRVDRLRGEKGLCGAASELVISSAGPHFGEESELVGTGGSGTIFFVNCNLECIFCQNWTISRGVEKGERLSCEELAAVMIGLQDRGCSNINLVSPTAYLYHITAAIDIAACAGLSLPVVYNCGGYETVSSLRLLEGFIDIYMPDAKYGSDETGKKYSGVEDYYTCLRKALFEMQKQVGDLQISRSKLAHRGMLIRHLVLPQDLAGSRELARFLSKELSANCAVNVMAQYYPAYRAVEFPPLDRLITRAEYSEARAAFQEAGLRLL